MALIKYGGGIIQMSGSIAGNTYARNRFGNYARARTKPVNPNTDLQDQYRSAVASLTQRWAQTVTAAQRAAWNLYGNNVNMLNRLGEVVHLTGFNHYIRSNVMLVTFDDTMDWDNETGGYLYLFQGVPQNPQRNFFDGPWRNYGMVSGVTGTPVVSPQVGAVQFAIAEGQRQWVYARIQRADGRLSEKFRDSTFCAA